MDVVRLDGGPWKQNCFLLISDDSAVLIDPGGNAPGILIEIKERGLRLLAIINTHGHFDHIGGVSEIVEKTSVPFYISGLELPIMKSANMLRYIFKYKEKVLVPNQFEDLDLVGNRLQFEDLDIQIFRTPGHTPGGCCFIIGNHIFTGDTVLSSMPGSAELPGGNLTDLIESLKALESLDGKLIAHPGHGRDSFLSDSLKSSKNWIDSRSV